MTLLKRIGAALLCAALISPPSAAVTIDRIGGVSPSVALKAPCVLATLTNITLAGEQTIDGVALVTGDRVLVANQNDPTLNGIYNVSTSAWLRATDFDGARDAVLGTLVWAGESNTYPAAFWQLTTSNPVTFGTSNITFAPADVYEAEIAKDNAEAAATSAQTQANIANGAATDAAGSASSAASSASTASTAAATASSSATSATSSASSASSSASSASSSSTTAAGYAAALTGTSSTSVTIATGSQVFTTQSSKQFTSGTYVIVASAANVTNYMHGQVTSYSGTSLTVNVTDTGGSGTFTDWLIAVSGSRGAMGSAGASGSGSGDMLAANNLSDLTNKATARTNLQLGTGDTVTHDRLDLNNSTNQIVLDADGSHTGTVTMSALTAARTWTLPDKSGTYAMTSDVPTVGTSAGDVVALDGSAKLPAVDGSQLTNLPALTAQANIQDFTTSGTWTKPSGYGAKSVALIQCWGGGASGARSTSAGGGGGGSFSQRWVSLASLGTTETVTVGAGGASVTSGITNGNSGGNSSFGSWVTAHGGTAGSALSGHGGDGGGFLRQGILGVPGSNGTGGEGYGGSGTSAAPASDGYTAGGGGAGTGTSPNSAGGSVWGGGGGGGSQSGNPGTGGISQNAGNGGNGSNSGGGNGSAPAGGGGGSGTAGNSGAGARGEVKVTVWNLS